MSFRKTTNPELGPLFKKCRIDAGLTVEAVAAHLQITVEEFEWYESGIEPIPFSCIHALSKYLNAPTMEVMRLLNFD
jgi:hypothetical protein